MKFVLGICSLKPINNKTNKDCLILKLINEVMMRVIFYVTEIGEKHVNTRLKIVERIIA